MPLEQTLGVAPADDPLIAYAGLMLLLGADDPAARAAWDEGCRVRLLDYMIAGRTLLEATEDLAADMFRAVGVALADSDLSPENRAEVMRTLDEQAALEIEAARRTTAAGISFTPEQARAEREHGGRPD